MRADSTRGVRPAAGAGPARRWPSWSPPASSRPRLLVVGQAWSPPPGWSAPGRRRRRLATAAAACSWSALAGARRPSGWTADRRGRAAAAHGSATALRRRVVRAAAATGGDGRPASSGELAVLATRGVAAAEPYLTRYLPALVAGRGAAAADPRRDRDPGPAERADRGAGTLPLIPVFGALVGLATRDRAAAAVAGAGVAVRALPRRGARAADAGRLPPGRGAVATGSARSPTATAGRTAGHAAARLRLLGRPRAGRHAVGRAGRGHRRRPAGRRRLDLGPRWSCCCSRPRPTGRCAGSARSSTPRPRASRPSRPSAALDADESRPPTSRRRGRRPAPADPLDGLTVA